MLYGTNESSQSDKEEKDPNANDSPYHLETGDQAKPLSPGSDADHQHAHHLQEDAQHRETQQSHSESARIKPTI